MANPGSDPVLSRRLEELAREVDGLRRRLEFLERSSAERVTNPGPGSAPATALQSDQPPDPGPAPTGLSALFSRAATVCFLLVVALVLRTLADGRMLSLEKGIWLGLGYAVALSAGGWVLFRRRTEQASTFCVIGTALLATVILEGTSRHALVPPAVAYGMLTAVVVGTGVFVRDRAATWTVWGVGSAALGTGVALLASSPHFGMAAVLVLALNGLAGRRLVTPGRLLFRALAWLSYVALWGYWGVALSTGLQRFPSLPAYLAPGWFGLLLAGSLLYFSVSGLLEVRDGVPRWVDAFDASLLPLTLAWGHLVGAQVLALLHGHSPWFGAGELAIAVLLFGVGWVWQDRLRQRGSGLGLLAAAAATLLLLGLPQSVGSAASVVAWVAAAVALGRLSRRWVSGGTRFVSYLLPSAASLYAWFAADLQPDSGGELLAGICLALAAVGSGYHYRWLRAHGVPARSRFFTRVDRRDDTAAAPLVAAVLLGLAAARVWLHLPLAALLEDPAPALSAAVSALSSLAALGLIAFGQRRSDPQVRGVGVLVMGVVGVKVFAFDLLASHGLPLVLSVLSFGVAVGVGATLLRRAPLAAPGHGDPAEPAPELESGREGE